MPVAPLLPCAGDLVSHSVLLLLLLPQIVLNK
jgi:hypothetical protein